MSNVERYIILWQKCKRNSHLSKRFYVPSYEGYLPFFVSGKELEKLENKQNIELKEMQLLKGIMYGLYEFEHSPKNSWFQKKNRETLLSLLDFLGNGFDFDNPENMFLNVAHHVRKKNGNSASRIILETGKNLIQESSKIKSDLISDLWTKFSKQKESRVLLHEIITLIDQIDLSEVCPGAKELICYYGLCALVFVKDNSEISKNLQNNENSEISEYLQEYIYPNIENPSLKNNIIALIENPQEFTPKDMNSVLER